MNESLTSIISIALSENFIKSFIKKVIYRKKKCAVYTYSSAITKELIKKLSEVPKVKVIDIENDTKLFIGNVEMVRLEKLKESGNPQLYKDMLYLSCKKFFNLMVKYYISSHHIVVISEDKNLLNFLGINQRIISICPSGELHDKQIDKELLSSMRVNFYRTQQRYTEFESINDAISIIKRNFRIL